MEHHSVPLRVLRRRICLQEPGSLASPGAMVGQLAALLGEGDNDITAAFQAAMDQQAQDDAQHADAAPTSPIAAALQAQVKKFLGAESEF